MIELLRLILRNEFWQDNKQNITRTMFPSNLQGVYDTISRSHEKLKRDLSIQEVKALWTVDNPVATKANKDALFMILDELPRDIHPDIAKEVLKKAWIIEAGRRLSLLGIDIVNGKEARIEDAKKLINNIELGRMAQYEDLEAISSELEDVLAAIDLTMKWQFNITNLQQTVPGIGPGIFKAAFGRVESGKSAYWISLCAAPSGFAHQGAKVFAYCNEEAAQRSQGRAIMSCTGLSLDALRNNKDKARLEYAKIQNNLRFFECKGMDIYQIEAHVKHHKPDIIVVDQLDKVEISGSFAREDERLGALYVHTRDICVKYGCAGIAISQANAEAEGKTYLSTANMVLSRTAKSAELDVLIGIGKHPSHGDTHRVLNIVKNKLSGDHQDVICELKPEISRYVD